MYHAEHRCLCADVVVALLAMNAVYRAWRFPDEATLLQAGLSFAELHSNALPTQHSSGACATLIFLVSKVRFNAARLKVITVAVLLRDTAMTMKHNSRREPESAHILSSDD